MQDDLFGDAAPQPPAKSLANAAPRVPSASSAGQNAAKVRPAPTVQAWCELARQLPAQLRFGVSTWSYPGWEGLVWDGVYDASTLSKNGLDAYHRHPLLRTVCVDRTFWRPLTASQYAAYAGQVDDDFRFVVKCPASITDAQIRSAEGKGREPNPGFLEPSLAIEHFVQPTLQGLGAKLGVLVFQLSPLPWSLLSRPMLVLDRLDRMLVAVRQALHAHASVIVAVEVRDPELLGKALVDTLKAHGATFCLGLHAKMPPIEEQLPMLRALWPGPLVCRWNLNRIFGAYGYADAQKKHDPFNAILSEDPHTRAVLARTIRGITGAGQPAYVTISNDAEGCAPLSIQKLAQAVVA
ncbi:DUF72 domain-containing protein [Parapusillimonas granuli]|uniref:DUF72 domain-containing protein n=1 Tax=Parapusillimonas granuli TaxID=380911 RepID=A0A853G0D9_9BURK|nr:DUF72 domain-containing protein [Parapusillimonas granuli]MBB5217546.1 uncharacterized protein YecE (DUF72 family) [Parapusillimonas granuli]NYT51825.1 DUF72 domain-containing protein [Parapusillimonas granuli]